MYKWCVLFLYSGFYVISKILFLLLPKETESIYMYMYISSMSWLEQREGGLGDWGPPLPPSFLQS